MISSRLLSVCVGCCILTPLALGREWTDKSGQYRVEAELVAVEGQMAVLRSRAGKLIMVDVQELSEKDRSYLKNLEGMSDKGSYLAKSDEHQWKLTTGQTIEGSVTDLAVQELNIYRKDSKVHVNFNDEEQLRPVYRSMLPAIVNHFAGTSFQSIEDLEKWLAEQRPPSVRYIVESVVISGAEIGSVHVPVILLEEAEQKYLAETSQRLRALRESDATEEERQRLLERERLAARAYYRNRQLASHPQELQLLRLQMLDGTTGASELWEVVLKPPSPYLMPFTVVVPAANSAEAESLALTQYPQHHLIGISPAVY